MVVFPIANDQRGGRGGVVEAFAVDAEIVMSDRGFFGRNSGSCLGAIGFATRFLAAGGALLLLGMECRHGAENGHGAQRKGAGDAMQLSQLDLRISNSRKWISVEG